MARTIRTSRHGLTHCASCGRHVQVEAGGSGAAKSGDGASASRVCAFCGAPLAQGPRSRAGSIPLGARGGLIAAALLGAPLAAAGCDADTTEVVADVAGDAEVVADVPDRLDAPLYGGVSTDSEVTADVPDSQPVDVYGAPPVDDAVTTDAPAPLDAPVYGSPPMDDAITADVPDSQPVDVYGAPPMDDAITEDVPDVQAVDVYGAPPTTDD